MAKRQTFKQLIESRGFTPVKIAARKGGPSMATTYRAMRGSNRLSLEAVRDYARILGCGEDDVRRAAEITRREALSNT